MRQVGSADGGVVLVDAMDGPDESVDRPREGTLALPVEVASWIGDAVAAGVTFDVLKQIAVGLTRRGWRAKPAIGTADSVTEAVLGYLRSSGYSDIMVREMRKVAGYGWTLAGTADGSKFKGLADEGGNVIYVRVE